MNSIYTKGDTELLSLLGVWVYNAKKRGKRGYSVVPELSNELKTKIGPKKFVVQPGA